MNHKVSLREKIAFALGDVGCNFIWTVVGSFLTLYYTDSVGISAAVVGTIMLITRILDGVSDLGMGVIIDHTHTRWGKARPWVLITAPLMGIGLILTFSVPNWLSENGKIAYAVVTYILLAVIIFTACNLAYSTLTALITGRQDDRTSMTSIRYILVYAVMILISYTTMPLVEDFGWTGMSVIFGIAGMICLLITFFGTKERNIDWRRWHIFCKRFSGKFRSVRNHDICKLHTDHDWAFCLPWTCRKIWKMEMYVSWVHS